MKNRRHQKKPSQIGELGIIKKIRKLFNPLHKKDKNILLGISDDAASIQPPKHKQILISTDIMTEGVHFDLDYTSFFQLGFKLVSVNVSDIMAMGGEAKYIFLNLAIRKKDYNIFFDEFLKGISFATKFYNIYLLGGDVSSAKNDITVSATIIGFTSKIITRHGAKVKDKIYVTSTLGDSACGLKILKMLDKKSRDKIKQISIMQKSLTDIKFIFKNQNLSVLRNRISQNLKYNLIKQLLIRHLFPIARDPSMIKNYATAMIDISDGLFIDLWRLCQESKKGAKIFANKIPISLQLKQISEKLNLDPFSLATSCGEDYELLFTAPYFPLEEFNKKNLFKISCIGEIATKGTFLIDEKDKVKYLKQKGYQHF